MYFCKSLEVPKNQQIVVYDIKDSLEAWIFYFKNEGTIKEDEMTVLLKDNPAFEKAHRVYQEFTANDELMDMVEAREKWRKDVNTRLHEAEIRGLEQGIQKGMQQGMQQGIQQGMQQGMQQKALESARKMLAENMSIDSIAKFTGLTEDEIKKIQ